MKSLRDSAGYDQGIYSPTQKTFSAFQQSSRTDVESVKKKAGSFPTKVSLDVHLVCHTLHIMLLPEI